MPMYNMIEYNDNYSKTSGSLWHYYIDEPFFNADGDIADFPADNNNSASFEFKTKLVGRIGKNGRKDAKMRVPLKHLSNFWRTIEMPLINCEINLIPSKHLLVLNTSSIRLQRNNFSFSKTI